MHRVLVTRITGIGTLRDTGGLLLLAPTTRPRTNLDDADVWARAVKLCAEQVLILPSDDDKLASRLTQHLGAPV